MHRLADPADYKERGHAKSSKFVCVALWADLVLSTQVGERMPLTLCISYLYRYKTLLGAADAVAILKPADLTG